MKTFRIKIINTSKIISTLALITVLGACGSSGSGDGTTTPVPVPIPVPETGIGPDPVPLGTAGNFVILGKSAISNTGVTAVTGDMGVSPAAASFITGFSLVADATNVFSTSSLVAGKIYAANYAPPTPANMTTAVADMMTAYTDAAGRAPDVINLGAGDIGGMNLTPQTYKWTTGVLVTSNLTLTGGPKDRWIFQVASDLWLLSGVQITLAGGAQAKNIVWQVGGATNVATTAHLEGIVLSSTTITMNTGATANGRLFAQTAVTLGASTVTQPAL